MKRIFISENYIEVDEGAGSSVNLYSKKSSALREFIDHFSLESDNHGVEDAIIPYNQASEYFDEAGTTPYTEASLRTFLRANTSVQNSTSSFNYSDHFGLVDYNDAGTTATPINLVADTWTDVPNDTLGSFTNTAGLPNGITSLMDPNTGYLDFSELTIYSKVFIRIDFSVTPNTNNASLKCRMQLGQGAGTYNLAIFDKRLDEGSGKPYQSDKFTFYIYMGDNNTLGGVGKLQVNLSSEGTLINSGVAIDVIKK